MSKYFNKALFFQQWITYRFVMLGVSLIWIYYSSSVISDELSNFYSQVFNGKNSSMYFGGISLRLNFTMFIYLVLISAIMVMLTMGINKYKKFIFYGGQPITRSKFIGTNGIFTAAFSIVMVFIDYYIRLLQYLKNRKFYEVIEFDYLKIINVRALILIALLLAIIAFFFLIQGLYSNSIVSSILGIGAIFYIPVFIGGLNECLSYRFWPIKTFLQKVMRYLTPSYDIQAPAIGSNKFAKWYYEFTLLQDINYQHYLFIILLLIVASIIWSINFKIYNVIKTERVGAMFHFSICENVFKFAVAAFSLVITSVVLILIYQIYSNIAMGGRPNDFEENILPIFNIISVAMVPVVYKLEGKLIKRFVKN